MRREERQNARPSISHGARLVVPTGIAHEKRPLTPRSVAWRPMPDFSFRDPKLEPAALLEITAPYAYKFWWFQEHGFGRRYDKALKEHVTHGPHYYQQLFHANSNPDTRLLCRFRHLVAGRRGGKTLCAAWEVLFYVLHPQQFHLHVHGSEDERPLRVWVLVKDLKVGWAALDAFREAVRSAGLVHRKDYEENKSELRFEFSNGSRVQFRTAVDPQSLRGPGLDILWMDEAAFIPTREAYDVISPALDDMEGIIICTTTPDGKNWYHEEFFTGEAMEDKDIGRVEYRSLDNPHFPRARWEYRKRTYHPLLFKQEYEASFDSMAGKELPGHWLTDHFYVLGKREDNEFDVPRDENGKLALTTYMGVDPAISLADEADHFAMSLIGVTKDHRQVFLLETLRTKIPFAEQVDVIMSWFLKYRPALIGIEAQAYQRALAQAVMVRENMPPVVPMMAVGKKAERIMSMSMHFRVGKVRVRADHRDFIDEWLNYDTTLKNPKDDLLDSVEIALRTAGALLPINPSADLFRDDAPAYDIQELAKRDLVKKREDAYDSILGADW